MNLLDLQWVHWGSFGFGVVSAYAAPWVLFAVVVAVFRLGRWLSGVRRGAERRAERAPDPWDADPMEDPTAVSRRLLVDMFRERPIQRAPREVLLSPEESRDLWHAINGDRGMV